MKLRGHVAALVVASVLAACGGGSDGPNEAAAPEEQEAAADVRPEPVAVSLVPDPATAASGTIGGGGGSVTATGVDGTTYELLVPAGALAGDLAVTVTPLTAMEGLPEGIGLRHGVDFAPDGVAFAAPGWLVITPAAPVESVAAGVDVHDGMAVPTQVGFDGSRFFVPVVGFSGAGTLGPFGPGPDGGGFGWPLPPSTPQPPSGSGYGTGPVDVPTGFPGFEPPGTPPGPGPGESSGGTTTGTPSLTDGLDAGGSSGDPDDGLRDALRDKAEAQLTGDEEKEKEADERLDKERDRLEGDAWDTAERCIRQKDVKLLRKLVELATKVQLLGTTTDRGDERMGDLIAACAQFTLDVYGEAGFDMGGVFVINDSIQLAIPLAFEGAWVGSSAADMQTEGYDRGVELIELLGFGLGAAMGIDVPNNIDRNDHIRCSVTPPKGEISAVVDRLLADTGPVVDLAFDVLAEADVACPDPIGSFPMPPMALDLELYQDMGWPNIQPHGLRFEGFTVTPDASPFASKEEHKEIASEGITMKVGWHLELRHTPGELPEGDPRGKRTTTTR